MRVEPVEPATHFSMKLARPVQTGDLVANTYRLEYVLGQGTSGIVFAARDRRSTERVAIKFLRRDLARNREAVAGFRAHARAAAAVRCDEICRVLALAESHDGVPCMIMEYLDGCDLASEAATHPHYDYPQAVHYMLQACSGLAVALRLGLIHGDLKPSKLFVLAGRSVEPRLKLLDLGNSLRAAPQLLAASRQARGDLAALWLRSAEYAAPEQLDASGLVDARTNVWAIGAILYLLLCGRPPFDEPTPQRLLAAIRGSEPSLPRALGVNLPEGLTRVLRRALAKARAERFASVAELAGALAPYAPSRELRANEC